MLLPGAAADTEIWLLSGPECNICSIYRQVDAYRGYGDHLQIDDAQYRIRRADKQDLPPMLADHFGPAVTDDADWPIQLTVAVVDSNNVLFSANIAESVDGSDGRIAVRYMDPPSTESKDALHAHGFDYAEYFRTQINLEYFLAWAKGSTQLPYKGGDVRVVASPQATNSKPVSIWGSAVQPAHNGLFIATRIGQLIDRVGRERLWLTYANGSDTSRRDTLILDDGA